MKFKLWIWKFKRKRKGKIQKKKKNLCGPNPWTGPSGSPSARPKVAAPVPTSGSVTSAFTHERQLHCVSLASRLCCQSNTPRNRCHVGPARHRLLSHSPVPDATWVTRCAVGHTVSRHVPQLRPPAVEMDWCNISTAKFTGVGWPGWPPGLGTKGDPCTSFFFSLLYSQPLTSHQFAVAIPTGGTHCRRGPMPTTPVWSR
jgi:hypothetical protein